MIGPVYWIGKIPKLSQKQLLKCSSMLHYNGVNDMDVNGALAFDSLSASCTEKSIGRAVATAPSSEVADIMRIILAPGGNRLMLTTKEPPSSAPEIFRPACKGIPAIMH